MPWFYGYTRVTRQLSRSSIFQGHLEGNGTGVVACPIPPVGALPHYVDFDSEQRKNNSKRSRGCNWVAMGSEIDRAESKSWANY